MACVIVAAGQGRRLGGVNKALLTLRDKTFLSAIIGRCRALQIEEIVVVVAEPYAIATSREANRLGVRFVVNGQPSLGMGASVAVGFTYALRNFRSESAWLWPVDTPAVLAESLKRISAHRHEASIVIPSFGGRGGHPTLVARSVWRALTKCAHEPEGARSVFSRYSAEIARVAVDDAMVCVDVDRPDDLEVLRKRSKS